MASWPSRSLPVDGAALEAFAGLQGVVRALRNARAEYNVEAGRKIGATLVVADEGLRKVGGAGLGVAGSAVCVVGGLCMCLWRG